MEGYGNFIGAGSGDIEPDFGEHGLMIEGWGLIDLNPVSI